MIDRMTSMADIWPRTEAGGEKSGIIVSLGTGGTTTAAAVLAVISVEELCYVWHGT